MAKIETWVHERLEKNGFIYDILHYVTTDLVRLAECIVFKRWNKEMWEN